VCLVEEQLRASSTVRSVVERSFGARLEPLSEPEDTHEVIVVPLRRGEIWNAYADVVDESSSGQRSPPADALCVECKRGAPGCRTRAGQRRLTAEYLVQHSITCKKS
jgi:hypothetical protein